MEAPGLWLQKVEAWLPTVAGDGSVATAEGKDRKIRRV
jgi:hypothetical protein